MDAQIPRPKHSKKMVCAVGLTTIFLWASNFTAAKYALRVYSPEAVMLIRFFIASITLGTIGMVKKINPPRGRDLPMFAGSGFVGIFLYMWLFNTGLKYVDTGVTSFIIASAPVFALVLSRFLLKETVNWVCWAGVGVSFCGLIIMMVSQATDFSLNSGMVLLLLAALAHGGYSILQRKLSKTYTALEATAYTIFAATCFMLIFLPSAFRQFPGSTAYANLALVYAGIFPGALAYLGWGYLLSKVEKTAHATVFLFLNPFVASVFGYFLLNETLSALSLLGGVVIIAGMLLTNVWGGRQHKSK